MEHLPRIHSDFHDTVGHGCVELGKPIDRVDIAALGNLARPGTAVTLFCIDSDADGQPAELEVDAILDWDDKSQQWLGRYDPTKFRVVPVREEDE